MPLLVVLAQNDPLGTPSTLGSEAVERAAREGGALLMLAVTPEGGHSLVWPEGWTADRTWACKVVAEWVRTCADSEKIAGVASAVGQSRSE